MVYYYQTMLGGEQQDTWPFVASIIYTTAWCISFYGQLYENYRLKSVEGFSLDYLLLNVTGYTLYTIYTSLGYFTDLGGAGTVVIADLIFVYHSVIMVIVQVVQCCIYERGENKISKQAVVIVIVMWVVVGTEAGIYLAGWVEWYEYWNPVTVLGYGKLTITLIKYTPPAYWNYKRKSTKGWSIFNILLDLVGGITSFASGGLSVENGLNLTKVILAFITVAYDLFFCFQHYVLYKQKEPANKEQNLQESLIVPSDTSGILESK